MSNKNLLKMAIKSFFIFSLSISAGIAYFMTISSRLPLHSQNVPKYKEIDLAKAKERFDKGWLFVDARATISWKEAHIKGAISFPAGEFLQRITAFEKKYPKDTKIVVYCSGVGCSTSYFLGEKLAARGYKYVEVFYGGWNQWASAGYPVEKGQ